MGQTFIFTTSITEPPISGDPQKKDPMFTSLALGLTLAFSLANERFYEFTPNGDQDGATLVNVYDGQGYDLGSFYAIDFRPSGNGGCTFLVHMDKFADGDREFFASVLNGRDVAIIVTPTVRAIWRAKWYRHTGFVWDATIFSKSLYEKK